MASEGRNARSVAQLENHLRFYKTTSLILLGAVVLLSAILIAGRGEKFGRAIKIDGDLVCLVNDKTAAEQVHEELLQQGKGELPGSASLAQQWQDEPWPVDDDEILGISEAVKRLQEHGVTVLVSAWTIQVNGVETVNLPGEQDARDVLLKIKHQYVPEDEKLIESSFLEEVSIVQTQAPAESVITEIASAVEGLADIKSEAEIYTVQPKDFPEKIAAEHDMPIEQFYRLNPETKGGVIHPGDRVKVSRPMGGITVKTITEVSETVDVEPEVQKVRSVHVPRGETRVASEGVPGKKLVIKHKTYHNDELIQTEIKDSRMVEKPSPKRVIVGTDDASSASGDDEESEG
ncbi:MAG: G5 domain-containing protein [Armatimonadota bacterium]